MPSDEMRRSISSGSVEKLDELTQAMLAYYQDNIADSGEGLHLLDGVGGVLAALGTSLIFSGSDAGLNNEPWILDPADATR